ncbi:MAG: TerB family tellurite resistance protein [Cyclobacteriaceae bacterium]|nr:TerB family tellurite resistance protein [Cyclobacteriaceae bacterium]
MSFNDIIDLLKLGKATAKSHMRNLIEIAAADGSFRSEEQKLLQYAAQRNNISTAELKDIQESPSKVRFQVPGNEEDKFTQLYDLVHMMSVDKNIHSEELRLCEIFAIKFGYRKEVVREMIEMIRQNIEKWIGPKETMEMVLREMKVYE